MPARTLRSIHTPRTIRPRTDTDLSACVDALATVHKADSYPVRWPADPAGWLTPQGMVGAWVAAEDATVLGHVALSQPDPELTAAVGRPAESLAAITRLFVDVSARGRGLARDLLAHAAQAAHAMDLQPVLEVESGATAAIALYERTGWQYVSSTTAAWIAPNGRPAELRVYLGPV